MITIFGHNRIKLEPQHYTNMSYDSMAKFLIQNLLNSVKDLSKWIPHTVIAIIN